MSSQDNSENRKEKIISKNEKNEKNELTSQTLDQSQINNNESLQFTNFNTLSEDNGKEHQILAQNEQFLKFDKKNLEPEIKKNEKNEKIENQNQIKNPKSPPLESTQPHNQPLHSPSSSSSSLSSPPSAPSPLDQLSPHDSNRSSDTSSSHTTPLQPHQPDHPDYPKPHPSQPFQQHQPHPKNPQQAYQDTGQQQQYDKDIGEQQQQQQSYQDTGQPLPHQQDNGQHYQQDTQNDHQYTQTPSNYYNNTDFTPKNTQNTQHFAQNTQNTQNYGQNIPQLSQKRNSNGLETFKINNSSGLQTFNHFNLLPRRIPRSGFVSCGYQWSLTGDELFIPSICSMIFLIISTLITALTIAYLLSSYVQKSSKLPECQWVNSRVWVTILLTGLLFGFHLILNVFTLWTSWTGSMFTPSRRLKYAILSRIFFSIISLCATVITTIFFIEIFHNNSSCISPWFPDGVIPIEYHSDLRNTRIWLIVLFILQFTQSLILIIVTLCLGLISCREHHPRGQNATNLEILKEKRLKNWSKLFRLMFCCYKGRTSEDGERSTNDDLGAIYEKLAVVLSEYFSADGFDELGFLTTPSSDAIGGGFDRIPSSIGTNGRFTPRNDRNGGQLSTTSTQIVSPSPHVLPITTSNVSSRAGDGKSPGPNNILMENENLNGADDDDDDAVLITLTTPGEGGGVRGQSGGRVPVRGGGMGNQGNGSGKGQYFHQNNASSSHTTSPNSPNSPDINTPTTHATTTTQPLNHPTPSSISMQSIADPQTIAQTPQPFIHDHKKFNHDHYTITPSDIAIGMVLVQAAQKQSQLLGHQNYIAARIDRWEYTKTILDSTLPLSTILKQLRMGGNDNGKFFGRRYKGENRRFQYQDRPQEQYYPQQYPQQYYGQPQQQLYPQQYLNPQQHPQLYQDQPHQHQYSQQPQQPLHSSHHQHHHPLPQSKLSNLHQHANNSQNGQNFGQNFHQNGQNDQNFDHSSPNPLLLQEDPEDSFEMSRIDPLPAVLSDEKDHLDHHTGEKEHTDGRGNQIGDGDHHTSHHHSQKSQHHDLPHQHSHHSYHDQQYQQQQQSHLVNTDLYKTNLLNVITNFCDNPHELVDTSFIPVNVHLSANTPHFGPGTPHFGPGTPHFGSKTPNYGSKTPKFFERTPDYRSKTPNYGPKTSQNDQNGDSHGHPTTIKVTTGGGDVVAPSLDHGTRPNPDTRPGNTSHHTLNTPPHALDLSFDDDSFMPQAPITAPAQILPTPHHIDGRPDRHDRLDDRHDQPDRAERQSFNSINLIPHHIDRPDRHDRQSFNSINSVNSTSNPLKPSNQPLTPHIRPVHPPNQPSTPHMKPARYNIADEESIQEDIYTGGIDIRDTHSNHHRYQPKVHQNHENRGQNHENRGQNGQNHGQNGHTPRHRPHSGQRHGQHTPRHSIAGSNQGNVDKNGQNSSQNGQNGQNGQNFGENGQNFGANPSFGPFIHLESSSGMTGGCGGSNMRSHHQGHHQHQQSHQHHQHHQHHQNHNAQVELLQPPSIQPLEGYQQQQQQQQGHQQHHRQHQYYYDPQLSPHDISIQTPPSHPQITSPYNNNSIQPPPQHHPQITNSIQPSTSRSQITSTSSSSVPVTAPPMASPYITNRDLINQGHDQNLVRIILKGHQPDLPLDDWVRLSLAKYYSRYAIGAYGWPLYVFDHCIEATLGCGLWNCDCGRPFSGETGQNDGKNGQNGGKNNGNGDSSSSSCMSCQCGNVYPSGMLENSGCFNGYCCNANVNVFNRKVMPKEKYDNAIQPSKKAPPKKTFFGFFQTQGYDKPCQHGNCKRPGYHNMLYSNMNGDCDDNDDRNYKNYQKKDKKYKNKKILKNNENEKYKKKYEKNDENFENDDENTDDNDQYSDDNSDYNDGNDVMIHVQQGIGCINDGFGVENDQNGTQNDQKFYENNQNFNENDQEYRQISSQSNDRQSDQNHRFGHYGITPKDSSTTMMGATSPDLSPKFSPEMGQNDEKLSPNLSQNNDKNDKNNGQNDKNNASTSSPQNHSQTTSRQNAQNAQNAQNLHTPSQNLHTPSQNLHNSPSQTTTTPSSSPSSSPLSPPSPSPPLKKTPPQHPIYHCDRGPRVQILHANTDSDYGQCTYYVAMDFLTRHIVIAIRGTMSLADTITDLDTELVYLPFAPKYYGHKGIYLASEWLIRQLNGDSGFNLHRFIKKYRQIYNIQGIIVTGHSLGAGVSTIVTAMLSQQYMDVLGICFAPPPCLCPELTERLFNKIITITHHNDIIPRLSIAALFKLKQQMFNAFKVSISSRIEIMTHMNNKDFSRVFDPDLVPHYQFSHGFVYDTVSNGGWGSDGTGGGWDHGASGGWDGDGNGRMMVSYDGVSGVGPSDGQMMNGNGTGGGVVVLSPVAEEINVLSTTSSPGLNDGSAAGSSPSPGLVK